jgi:tetratricopeptide (TPR) repeat protein
MPNVHCELPFARRIMLLNELKLRPLAPPGLLNECRALDTAHPIAAYHPALNDAALPTNLLSVLHVIASSPKVRDYAEAARLIAEKELLAIREGGPAQNSRLASVERHRGAVAYLMGDHAVALEYFSRAFERQRSAGNLANVLNALIRLGDRDEAVDLLRQVRATLPERLNADLTEMISVDPDLALLRREL